MVDLHFVRQQIREDPQLMANVTSWRTLDSRGAAYGSVPAGLDTDLQMLLRKRGTPRLYRHQSLAVRRALEGEHLIIVTPTSSGKTLCYNLPVLHSLLWQPDARALYLFPTKALAHDQLHTLRGDAGLLGLDVPIEAYDGDTPRSRRRRIRDNSGIILTNPDMLHVGILPHHTQWHDFFSHLRYVVIDEIHTYRGIFGSHVANVFRRLKRICQFYGNAPQFICSSATIANPAELAERLFEEKVSQITENGAPRGRRDVIFYNPPIVDRQMGLRRSPLLETQTLAGQMLDAGLQVVVFGRSRRTVEKLVLQLRQKAGRHALSRQEIRGYRGGYLPEERREIEQGLQDGTVRCVVATNALELGIDIGSLQACILVGYPGTIASTWQQMGRVGRGREESIAFLVASSSPLDQYIISHPRYLFGRSPEHALINEDNLYVLLDHIKCAVAELPFTEQDDYGGEDLQRILALLEKQGAVHKSRARWYWTGDTAPAPQFSLRSARQDDIIVCQDDGDEREVIGQIDRATAPVWVHEGAIYLHEGQRYLVESLDWEGGIAHVRPVEVDFYTEASQNTRIDIQGTMEERARPHMHLARGEVVLTTRATGYRRLRPDTMEHLGWGEIDLPEQSMLTAACWLTVPEHVVSRLRDEGWWDEREGGSRGPNWPTQSEKARRRDGYRCRQCGASQRSGRKHDVHHIRPFREFNWLPGKNENYRQANALSNLITLCPSCHRKAEQAVAVRGTLARLAHVLRHVIPLHLMCDYRDIGVLSDGECSQTGAPTVFIYDQITSGVGLSDEAFFLYEELLYGAAELVRDCSCEGGCPSCIGVAGLSHGREKAQVLRLIDALQRPTTLRDKVSCEHPSSR
ncbi:MAG: DEAD/DEAH box helicase [Anaerolineales bacterium]